MKAKLVKESLNEYSTKIGSYDSDYGTYTGHSGDPRTSDPEEIYVTNVNIIPYTSKESIMIKFKGNKSYLLETMEWYDLFEFIQDTEKFPIGEYFSLPESEKEYEWIDSMLKKGGYIKNKVAINKILNKYIDIIKNYLELEGIYANYEFFYSSLTARTEY